MTPWRRVENASSSHPMRSGAGAMCVLFKLLKPDSPLTPIKLPPNWAMAAAVSVGSATKDENTDTRLKFAPGPLHENYDTAADHETWMPGGHRRPGLEAGEEDSTSERECQRRVEEDLTSVSPEEIESRLERTRREFYNRRKIIIKNLPSDVSNQVRVKEYMVWERSWVRVWVTASSG